MNMYQVKEVKGKDLSIGDIYFGEYGWQAFRQWQDLNPPGTMIEPWKTTYGEKIFLVQVPSTPVVKQEDKKLILDACCGGKMFWYQKDNENTVYMDNRVVDKGYFDNNWNPNWCVHPDTIADFRNMPFPDKSFKLIIFDPPHLTSGSEKSVINKKYGLLNKDTWKEDIIAGFKECWRVLDGNGVLIFKWNEANIKASSIIEHLPFKPLFGDFTGKTGKTIWMTFMKISDSLPIDREVPPQEVKEPLLDDVNVKLMKEVLVKIQYILDDENFDRNLLLDLTSDIETSLTPFERK